MRVTLQRGKYPGATFNDLVTAVVEHNIGLNKAHRIRERRKHRISVICSAGAEKCAFRAYATPLKNATGIRITNFEQHSCQDGSQRARQVKSTVLAEIAPAISDFEPSKRKAGGNARQIQDKVKRQAGIDLKPSQAHKIVKSKTGVDVQHIGQYRILPSFMRALKHGDPGGYYEIEMRAHSDSQAGSQFRRLFITPSGVVKNWPAHNGLVTVDATYLTGMAKGILLLATCYDSNQNTTVLAFSVVRTEDAASWAWFLERIVSAMQGMRAIMSDGTEGLGEIGVQMTLQALQIAHVRCAWHLISKNLKNSTLRATQAEYDLLYKVVYARTREYANLLLSTISSNAPLLEWWRSHENDCATYILLEKGVYRLGTVKSNSSEQAEGVFGSERELPIVDMITAIVARMSNDTFHRGKAARNIVNENKQLTPYAYRQHTAEVGASGKLNVEEEALENGALRCVVRATPMSASYNVRVTPEFSYECVCKYGAEYLRPCAHVIAAIMAAYRNTKHDAYNVWDARWFSQIWHAETWLRQHAHPIKRAAVKGAELEQTALLPADLPRKPGRKRKRPYEPSGKQPRTCAACGLVGHFASCCPNPDIRRLAYMNRKAAEKAADNTIAALTQREQERRVGATSRSDE